MRRNGTGSGGGYGSRQHVQIPVRPGIGSKSARPQGVAMFGQMQGSHTTNRRTESSYRGEPLHNDRSFQPTKFGNEIAVRTVCKPGGSREVMASGSQGQHGSVAGNRAPQGRQILNNE
jgi:hypothetical protein